MAQRAIRGNTVPPGGPAIPAAQGVTAGGMLLPDTIQLQEMADLFFENSEHNYLQLNTETLVPGRETQFRLQNVGLGESLELFVTGSFNLRNAAATPQTVNLSHEFPYNLISRLTLMFNGKVALVNASGYDLLRMMIKRNYKSQFVQTFDSDVSAPPRERFRIDSRLANIRLSAGTLVAGDTLLGFSGITIPATTTITVFFEMYLDLSFIMRKDIPFGLIPMQHNAIYANIAITTNTLLSDRWTTPLQAPTATLANVFAEVPAITCLPTYNFWGLPANPELYNFFVNNSYVVTAYPTNAITSTGVRGLTFNFPLNYWLISAMFTPRMTDGRLANVRSHIDNPVLVYNGTIHVDRSEIRTRVAREVVATGRTYPYGTLLFDGAQTNNLEGNSANMSRWLNMYQANNPAYYADIMGGFTIPGTFDAVLEQLIPNYVTVL